MKNVLIALMLISTQAFATSEPALIETSDMGRVETLAKKAVADYLNVTSKSLVKFHLVFNNKGNECIEVKSEMDPNVSMGVCSVQFAAFQVIGHISFTKKASGALSVSVIHADVE